METMICSYSSDARTLYKADIYKVLSMPKGFIVHFRYKKKYVDDSIVTQLNDYIGKEVIIFYTLTKENKNIPIRKAKLVKVEINEETGLFHAYMELDKFTNLELEKEKPTDKFFTSQNIKFKNEDINWIDKIEQVKDSFKDMLFYHIKSITDYNGKVIPIKHRKDKKASWYKLSHGKKYFIELSIGNPKESESKLSFTSSSMDVTANISNPIEITAQYDDISVPIYIKSLNVSNDSSIISFSPTSVDNLINTEYNLNIEISKSIGYFKPIAFGILTLLALVGFVLVKDGYDSFSRLFSWQSPIDSGLVLGVFLLVLSSTLLFYFFNKK
ncbi:hypothetical protein [Arenibacter sp. F20364]|uniref:hypothetical protein n=1 Tax=Arenibacter sp. F20364 TaxID=2926415 RepID=UPI001FF3E505|nr:hypothetical protein [Arenibacter sp. F20364]MCK0190848.1 hypothetical protein [Arenibacter sp. F20364]